MKRSAAHRSARMLPAAIAAGSIPLLLSLLVGVPSASADEIARMEIIPASGTLDTPIDLHIGVPCPANAPNSLVVLTGPGLSPAGENLVGNTVNTSFEMDSSGTVIVPLIDPLTQVQQLLPAGKRLNGDYRITMICREPLDATSLGEFNAFLRINGKKQTFTELPDGADVPLPGPPTMLLQSSEGQAADNPATEGQVADSSTDTSADAGAEPSAAPAGSGTDAGSANAGGGSDGISATDDAPVTALANSSGETPQVAEETQGSPFPISYLLILVGALLIGGGAMALVRRRAS